MSRTRAAKVLAFVWNHPANRAKRGRAIVRLVSWQIWERTTGLPWTIGLHGMRLRCYPHSTGATGVLYCGLPEWHDMRFLLDFLQPGDLFVDVGANVGVYSLLACTVEGTQVVAFEPGRLAYERLQENIGLNSLSQRVRPVMAAVGATPGVARMTTQLDTRNRLLESEGDGESAEVELTTLDASLGGAPTPHLGLIKIDVEGYETPVLEGGLDLLRTFQPALIIEANDPSSISSFLTPLGYAPFTYDPDRRHLTPATWDHGGSNNIIALANTADAARRVTGGGLLRP